MPTLSSRLRDRATIIAAGLDDTTTSLLREAADRIDAADCADLSHELGSEAEHDEVDAALERAGSIAGAAQALGLTARDVKVRIVRNRIRWPRATRRIVIGGGL